MFHCDFQWLFENIVLSYVPHARYHFESPIITSEREDSLRGLLLYDIDIDIY